MHVVTWNSEEPAAPISACDGILLSTESIRTGARPPTGRARPGLGTLPGAPCTADETAH